MEKELLYTVDNFVPYLEIRLEKVKENDMMNASDLFHSEAQRYYEWEDLWKRRAWQHALLTVFADEMPLLDLCRCTKVSESTSWWEDLFYTYRSDRWWDILEAFPTDYIETMPLPPLNRWTGSLTPRQVASLYKKGWITDDGIAHFYLQGQAFGSHCTIPFLHMLRADLIEYYDMVGNRGSETVKKALKDFHEKYAAFETLYGSIPETTIVPIAYQRLRWTQADQPSANESLLLF